MTSDDAMEAIVLIEDALGALGIGEGNVSEGVRRAVTVWVQQSQKEG